MNNIRIDRACIEILDYQRRYAKHFRDLNYEWLEEFFEVEPYDEIVLNDPKKHIIQTGGAILFARCDREIVGTCALMKHTERKYELAKMGVAKGLRGRGVGRVMADVAIERARELGASTLILATSTILKPANHLYESLGFEPAEIRVLGPLPYKRESIAMSMGL